MSDYRRTFHIRWDYPINGLTRTAYDIADRNYTECKIDREEYKSGWFSKKYEYHITFIGEKNNVDKCMNAMHESAEYFNIRIHW